MTIVSDSFHNISIPLVMSNLDMLATFKVGDKPITGESTLHKEDRFLVPALRRALEGAFDAKVIEDTYRSACKIIDMVKDRFSHAQPFQLKDDAEKIRKKALRSLEGLKNIEQSYRKEAQTVYWNPSQKIETANVLRKIYETYHLSFTPESHSVSDLVSRFSQGGGSNERAGKALKSEKSTSQVTPARLFWKNKESNGKKSPAKITSTRKEKKASVELKESTETTIDKKSHKQLATVPIAQQEPAPLKKTSVPKHRVTTILHSMAQETLDEVRLRKSKKSKNPYNEKSSIRTFLSKKGRGSSSVKDVIKAVFEKKSSAISERYEDFESHQEQMKKERKKEQEKEQFRCFDLDMLNLTENDKGPSDDDVSEGSDSGWNDDEQVIMSMRREAIDNAQRRRPLTRSISLYPGTVNNRVDQKNIMKVKPVTGDGNFRERLASIRSHTQLSDEKTDGDYFSDDEDPFVE